MNHYPYIFTTNRNTSRSACEKFILQCFFYIAFSFCAWGQEQTGIIIKTTDSILVKDGKTLASCVVEIKNNKKESKTIFIKAAMPEGWKNLSFAKQKEITLGESDSLFLPMYISFPSQSNSEWSDVVIYAYDSSNTELAKKKISIRSEALYKLEAMVSNNEFVFTENPKMIALPLRLKNTGNVSDEYVVEWQSSYFHINKFKKIKLKPHTDTVVHYYLPISGSSWSNMTSSPVSVSIKGKRNELGFSYTVSKVNKKLKQHATPYKHIPIQLTGGAFLINNKIIYNYGVQGYVELGTNDNISFKYKSKQIGLISSAYLMNQFLLDYKHKDWTLSLGQVRAPEGFIVLGQGAALQYKSKKNNISYKAAAILHSRVYPFIKNDNYSFTANYQIGKAPVENILMFNKDLVYNINSYVANNSITLFNKENTSLKLYGGLSNEHINTQLTQVRKDNFDFMLGYEFYFNSRNWLVSSIVRRYGKDFAGVNKGLRFINQDVKYKLDANNTAGVFYTSNYMFRNYYRDSIYNSDILTYNNERMGVSYGHHTINSRYNVSLGLMKQNAQYTLYDLKQFYFLDVNMEKNFGTNAYLTFSSRNAFKENYNNTGKPFVITTSNLDYRNDWLLLSGIYVQYPEQNGDAQTPNKNLSYIQAMMGSIGFTYNLFDKNLSGNLRYAVSKTVGDQKLIYGVGGMFNYHTKKSGLNISFNAFLPFQKSSAAYIPFMNSTSCVINITQNINVPVIFKKKYHNMNVTLFNDENNNNIMDKEEQPIRDAVFTINDENVITDKNGKVTYKNLNEGSYKMNLMQAKVDSLIPAGNLTNEYQISQKDLNMAIPFKTGCRLQGKVDIILDSFSHAKFTPEDIKIFITDTLGNSYTAMTDLKGNFTTYIPAGKYSVRINAGLFEGSDFKLQQAAYDVNLTYAQPAYVTFTVTQKKRKVRYLK